MHDLDLNRYHQAFEDFLHTEGERAIAEATRHYEDGKRLWVVLYEDGRYSLEHTGLGAGPEEAAHCEHDDAYCVAVPIEPLRLDEYDRRVPENSQFARALDALWSAFRRAHGQAVHG